MYDNFMVNQQLLAYIKQQLQQGVGQEQITASLMTQGWQASDIQEAFNTMIPPSQLNQSNLAQPLNSLIKTLLTVSSIGILVIGGGVIGYFTIFNNSSTTPTVQKQPEQVSTLPSQQTQKQTILEPIGKPETTLEGWLKYTDQKNQFSFSYPPTLGKPSQGTNNGVGDRVAAIRFSEFSSGVQNGQIILGGEAALTKGFVLVDIQALGGLYDSITLEIFPDTLRNNIISSLPILTATNFCGELAKEQHVDLSKSDFASLSQQQKDAIVSMDKTRNIDPKVIRCDVNGDTVTFHKEATVELGQAKNRQNIYGAIHFLKPPFSSFQIIRATTETPSQEMLETITSVVNSIEF